MREDGDCGCHPPDGANGASSGPTTTVDTGGVVVPFPVARTGPRMARKRRHERWVLFLLLALLALAIFDGGA